METPTLPKYESFEDDCGIFIEGHATDEQVGECLKDYAKEWGDDGGSIQIQRVERKYWGRTGQLKSGPDGDQEIVFYSDEPMDGYEPVTIVSAEITPN